MGKIIGMDVPEALLTLMRETLATELNNEPALLRLMGGADSFILHRTAYTGDYTLEGWSKKAGFWPVAKFGMMPMPGCRAICVFHHAEVEPKFRGTGLGQLLLNVRGRVATKAGYSRAICTVRCDNEIERHLMNKCGWIDLTSFVNRTSNRGIRIYIKHL
jgi:GNAT superfamily N-acetyltransferase